MDLLAADGLGDFFYYALIYKFVQSEILRIGPEIMGRMMTFVGGISLVLMTVWILFNGFRIVSGQSRDSMMAFAMNAARNTFIVGVATTMTLGGSNLQLLLTDHLDRSAVELVTGNEDKQASDLIEQNLVLMQLALSSIDAVKISEVGSLELSDQKTRALWMVGLGAAGPPVVAGVMLLMYQVAIALFIGLGPLFVLTLMFEQTKQMFWKWLYYGIGTLFSMAVLALMTSLALKVVGIVTASFWITAALGGGDLTEGMGSRALQQGGIGVMLTMLLISVPPIASNFFQGAVSNFSSYSAFAGGASGAVGQRPGESGYRGPQSQPQLSPVNRGQQVERGLDMLPEHSQRVLPVSPQSPPPAGSLGLGNR
jgi:type IV secretion system protein VirB6